MHTTYWHKPDFSVATGRFFSIAPAQTMFECWLESFVIFRESGPVLPRNLIVLWFSRGPDPLSHIPPPCPTSHPPGSSYANIIMKYKKKSESKRFWLMNRFSPEENQNDLELDFKVFFFMDSCCWGIVLDESNWCHSGIIERCEIFKMASKMAVN